MELDLSKMRKLAEESGDQHETLAARAGMSKAQWSNLVNGHQSADVRLSTVTKIAHALRVDPRDLLK